MSYDDDPDLWQTDARCTDARSNARNSALTRAVREQVPLKRAILEQRRIDLQSITDLLSRAANDLRASERRAVEAEERTQAAEAWAADAEARAADAEARATDAEARERKINAQAARAFETMKERIATSEARAAEAQVRADELVKRLQDEQQAVARQVADSEKAAEARRFALEARLQAAEMRMAAARRALSEDVAPEKTDAERAEQIASDPSFSLPMRISSIRMCATDIGKGHMA